jgi:hypothetical protein
MLDVCCVFSHAINNDHGSCLGNTAPALVQWQCLVSSCEATVALHWAVFIALYRPGNMVIKIAINFVTFVYTVDNSAARKKNISPSFLRFS